MNQAARTAIVVSLFAVSAASQPSARGPSAGPSDRGEAAPTPPKPEDRCPRGVSSALGEIACELARALEGAPKPLLVSSSPLTSEAEVKSPRELITRLLSVVAGRIAEGAAIDSEPRSLNAARTAAKSRERPLLYLRPEIARGELRVVADVYPGPGRFWDRTRDPEPAASLHAFAGRRLDPELRSFLPTVPLVASRVDKAASPERQPVAVACDDLDGDGGLELVLIGRHHVHLGRIRSGRLLAHGAAAWKELSPIAQHPLQEPIGSASIAPGSHVDLGSSDRAFAVRLDPKLQEVARADRRLPWPGGGCSRLVGLAVEQKLEPCFAGDEVPVLKDIGRPADAIASARILDHQGQPRVVRAARIANTAEVVLRDDAGREAHVHNVGAQLALGDLDVDGQPELIAGANVLDPSEDLLFVFTWNADGSVTERRRVALPRGVRALAICPPEDAGPAPVVAAMPDAIWVLR